MFILNKPRFYPFKEIAIFRPQALKKADNAETAHAVCRSK
jgi:hypothetical protein